MNLEIIKGIQLPACDVELLTLGRLIAVPFRQNIREGEVLWLYPSQHLPDNLSLDQYYQAQYLTKAESVFAEFQTYPIQLKVWARCEYHWRINLQQKHLLQKIAESTVWKLEALEHIFEKYQVFKLLILRVYRLSNPCVVNVQTESGAFYWPQRDDVIAINSESDTPVISEANFYQRKALLVGGEVYPYKDLEALQLQVEQIGSINLGANQLNDDIKMFLGWSKILPTVKPEPDIDWIKTIAQIGNSSDGNTFEKLVRKSFIKLGFANSNNKPEASLNPESTGGAGGLDFYCETPYQVVGECKATKSETVADGTPAQLIKLGHKHLQEQYNCCIKIIMAAGQLNRHAKLTAIANHMNVIRPETLQRLVELKAKQPGSIDLLQLKPCLEQQPFGEEADTKVNRYIDDVREKLKVRSHIVQLVKDFLERTKSTSVEFNQLHGAYAFSMSPQPLKYEEMHEILIELSSPLTGFLGRIKGEDLGRDRFYFLRDLPLDD
ncbi:DUF1802 family protein [Microcoleus sp. OTE_8_concoct_300]|uniref:DUF1802 family protein n=1 Tax=Microcoleus sp. OTE_8_concoct_300 TaxID=2964710 RepID=UPI00403FB9E0